MEDAKDEPTATNGTSKSFDEEDSDHSTSTSESSDEGGQHTKRTWEESFALLVSYQKLHGHCQVPISFDSDRQLGRWVYSQRIRRDNLTSDQIRRLEELGFDEDENDHNNNDQSKAAKTTPSSHRRQEGEDEEEEEDEEDLTPPQPSFADEVGFTHTGRMRKAVKRYGITDNDHQSDIARRRNEQLAQQHKKKEKGQNSHRSMPPPPPRKRAASPPPTKAHKAAPAPAPAPPPSLPPPSVEEDNDVEDPDYDSAAERKEREKRRKQRQKEAAAAAANSNSSTTNKRGRPMGRPRGRPRKETLEEKLAQLAVGSRVAVLWPAENKYYHATVAKIVETRKRPYYLEYDDGENEWIDFATGQTDFLLLTPRTGPRKRNRSKPAACPTTPPPTSASAHSPTSPKSSTRSATTPSASSSSRKNQKPSIPIGSRVSVYWSDDEQYYEAVVVNERKDKYHPEPYKLEYEDGEYEWIDLHRHKFKFLEKPDDGQSSVRTSGRTRRKPRRIRDEDDEDTESSSSDEEELDDEEEDDMDDTTPMRTKHLEDNIGRGKQGTQTFSSSESSSDSSSSSSEEDSDIELVSDLTQVRLGARVAVYWSDHERYYEGTVTEHRKGHPMPFFLQYDDGDSQWIDLRRRNFCVLKKVRRRKRKRNKKKSSKRRYTTSDSSSDDSSSEEEVRKGFTFRKANSSQSAAVNSRRRGADTTSGESSDSSSDEDQKLQHSASIALKNPLKEMYVGTRVTVYCPAKGKYMDGTVTHRQIPRNFGKKPCYYVEYDRGHYEWIELPKRNVRLLKEDPSNPPASARKPLKRGRKKVHDSPLLRLLREKELRKTNPELFQDEEEEDDLVNEKTPPESDKSDNSDESSSTSSSSEDSDESTTEEDSSSESEVEEVTPNKQLVAEQIGIGSRIAVQCPLQLKFMEGTVTRLIRNRRKPFYVEYDIGGFEWIDVHCSLIKILTEEEEKILKEQSAIVVKEDVEEPAPAIQPPPKEEDDDSEKSEEEQDDRSDVDDMQVDNDEAEDSSDDMDIDNDDKAPGDRREPDANGKLDEDADMAPPSPVIAEDEPDRKRTCSDSCLEQSIPVVPEDIGMPSLQEEEPNQKEEINKLARTNSKKSSTPEKARQQLSGVSTAIGSPGKSKVCCTRIEIPRVSDTDGASVPDKDSPTAVTCVLRTELVPKALEEVESKTVSAASSVAPELPKCIHLKETDHEPKEATGGDTSSMELVRVAPVAIVSDTSQETLGSTACKKIALVEDSVETTDQQEGLESENVADVENTDEQVSLPLKSCDLDETAHEAPTVNQNETTGEERKSVPTVQEAIKVSTPGETPTPVKRKRGRPPKNRTPQHQVPDEKISHKRETAPSSVPAESSETSKKRGPGRPRKLSDASQTVDSKAKTDDMPKKRGPGRPPKKKTPQNGHEAAMKKSCESPSGHDQDKNNSEPPKKRGPGRPPKNKNIPKKAESATGSDAAHTKGMDVEEDSRPIVKRGPGRPRKSDTEPPKKRGPGRPPKIKSPEGSNKHTVDSMKESELAKGEPPKKRGPGRPRKHPLPDDAANGSEGNMHVNAAKKRGPGRPRKSDSQEPKKRGPGRPRKVPKEDEEADKALVEDIFKVTTVEGARPRKEPNRFSPTDFDGSESDSSADSGAPEGRGATPFKKSDFGPDHAKLASQLEVGMRVSVFWGGDEKYYPGTITKARSYRKKKFFLEYDDGEAEWIDFHRNKFHMLTEPRSSGPRLGPGEVEVEASDDDSKGSEGSNKRRKSESSETDPSNLIRNRMDMGDVMLRIQIGCRVEVFWSEDDCYYPGTITKQRDNIITSKKPFFLEYDDGESEWIDLRDHVFRLKKKEEVEPPPEKVEVVEPSNKEKRKRENDTEETPVKRGKRIKKKKIIQDF